MLNMALIFSGVLWLIANIGAGRWKYPEIVVFVLGTLLSFPCLSGVLYPLPILTVLFCLLLYQARKHFLPLSLIAWCVVFASFSVRGLLLDDPNVRLRNEYPYQSIEARLPSIPRDSRIAEFDAKQLDSMESTLEDQVYLRNDVGRRAWDLYRLHEATQSKFVESFGFGVGRMGIMRRPIDEGQLLAGVRKSDPIPQPHLVYDALPSIYRRSFVNPHLSPTVLGELHQSSVIDFLNPAGFGYFKDRQHVAGFQAHQFSKPPQPPTRSIEAVSVELVGWMRGSPVVYVSENLPAMNELRKAPTRALDAFEEEGLKSLRSGKDLFVKEESDRIRVLGSIRAMKQCIDCHGGKRGDLLGAFSYVLR